MLMWFCYQKVKQVLISKALVNLCVNHDEFVLKNMR